MINWIIILLVNAAGVIWSVRTRKLTPPAALSGATIACILFAGAGFTGMAMMVAFFLSGSVATSWKLKTKSALGLAESRDGRRRAAQVFANAGVAGIIGLIAIFLPSHSTYFQVLIAGSFAAAAGDTVSSELGNIYGKKYYNIRTLKRDQRGLNGVVSFEGTMAGIFASLLIALVFAAGTGGQRYILMITVAGFIGNLVDSYLGATVERSGKISNEGVNFLNTLSGALAAAAFYHLFFSLPFRTINL